MASRRTQLRYLVAVADEGQITAAATRLKLAQPTLSQAIAQLESELGVSLLERHRNGVTLTPAGEAFILKAREAVVAESEAARTAEALARADSGTMIVGFIGPPPASSTPELFTTFCEQHPAARIDFHDLPFPQGSTSAWLASVDVAVCHLPDAERGVSAHTIRAEPRAVVLHRDHLLAGRQSVSVEDVIDETFVGYHPSIQQGWAGFHSFDDYRGGPPRRLTDDRALTSLQMLGIMTASPAAVTVPYLDAKLAQQVLPIAVFPVADAAPAQVSLVWRNENRNPLLQALVSAARDLPPRARGL